MSGCSAGNRRAELLTDCFIFYFPTESGTGCGQTKSKKRIFFFIHTQGVWPGQTKSKKGAVMQTMTGPKDVYDTYTRAAAHLGARILKSPSMRAFISYIY